MTSILKNKINNVTTEYTQSGLGQINQMDSAFSSGPKDSINNKIKDNEMIIKMNEDNDNENDLNEFNDFNVQKNYNKNSYKNLKAISLVKLLSLLCNCFSLFNSLQRPDYFSALIGIITFGYIFLLKIKISR